MSWQYVAGFFDGEGSIMFDLHGTRHGAGVSFYQSDDGVLRAIQEFFSREQVHSYLYCVGLRSRASLRGVNQTRPQWQLQVKRKQSVKIALTKMLPFLIVKKVPAQDVLRFWRIYPGLNRGQSSLLWREETIRRYGKNWWGAKKRTQKHAV